MYKTDNGIAERAADIRRRLFFSVFSLVFLGLVAAPAALAASGYNWVNVTDGKSASGQQWYAIASSSTGQFLAADAWTGDVWTSNNFGQTWTNVSSSISGMHGGNWRYISASSTGQYITAVQLGGDIWVSNNYGASDSWTNVTSSDSNMHNKGWTSTTTSSTGQYVAVVTNTGAIWTSNNYGASDSWTNVTSGNASMDSQVWRSITSSASGQYVVAAINGGRIWYSNNYGASGSWTQSDAPSAQWAAIKESSDGQYLIGAVNNGDLYRSNDYGVHWTNQTSALSDLHNKNWNTVTISSTGQYMTSAVYGGDVWTSNDYGVNWTNVTDGTSASGQGWFAVASSSSNQYIVAGAYGGDIWIGTDDDLSISSAALSNAVDSAPVSLETPTGTNITCSSVTTHSDLDVQDTDYTYPLGLVSFCFSTTTADNLVTLTFVTDLSPSQVVPRYHDSTSQTYTTIAGATVTQTTYSGQPALALSYTITDNGSLDTNSAQYAIDDPVGLGVAASSVNDPGTSGSGSNSSSGSSGSNNDTAGSPDTGYGMPFRSSPWVKILLISSSVSIGAGLLLLYRQRLLSTNSLNS